MTLSRKFLLNDGMSVVCAIRGKESVRGSVQFVNVVSKPGTSANSKVLGPVREFKSQIMIVLYTNIHYDSSNL